MRVPDWACSCAIMASKVFGAVDPRGRVGATDEESGIFLLQVLEGEKGRKIYRFAIPEGIALFVVRDASGNRVEAVVRDIGGLGRADDDACFNGRMVSVEMPSSVGTFWLEAPGKCPLRIGALETRAREIQRNCLMVNPGIDSLYGSWIARKREEGPEVDASEFANGPLVSIVTPLFNTPIDYFGEMVNSVLSQKYENWELVLVNASPENERLRQAVEALDDERIVVVELEENKGISENTVAGIKASAGDYIAFLDHDDVIEPDLLLEYAKAISNDPEVDLLYCDEDSITHDGRKRFNPSLKFDFNLDLLLTHNYVCHMLAISRRAYEQIVPYDSTVDGAQDYDLTLKVSRVAKGIVRIPKVLYHWRQHSGSTNGGSTAVKPYVVDASINVLSGYLREDGIEAGIVPTKFPCVFEEAYPKIHAKDVSLAVVYDSPMRLVKLLQSLSEQDLSTVRELVAAGPSFDLFEDVYKPLGMNLEDADFHEVGADSLLSEIVGKSVRCLFVDSEDDFAAEANAAVGSTKGDYCLLIGPDVCSVAGSDIAAEMRSYFSRKDVGVVSAKAMAADGLVYHAGLCVKDDGSIGYLNQGFIEGMGGGYHGCAECACDFSAVDAICIMFRRSDFDWVGGFRLGYSDPLASSIDLSFKIRSLGKTIIGTPRAKVEVAPAEGRWVLGESYIAPESSDHGLLWRIWDEEYRTDVLQHPDIDVSTSYFRLKV